MAAGDVPYRLAMIQKVSPASIVIRLVLVAIVSPGTNAAMRSRNAVRVRVIPEEMRILARIENLKLKDIKIAAHLSRT